MKQLLAELSDQFEYRQCSACCRIANGIVRIDDANIAAMAAYLDLSEREVIDVYTELSPDRRGLILKSEPDGACVMLNMDGRCLIYDVRPAQCASFPFEWINDDSFETCEGLRCLPMRGGSVQ